jgi:hypothetical protein
MTPKYDYDFFLFTQLAFSYGKIDIELEYDLLFGDIIKLYEDFLTSHSNDDTKGLYECIEHYFMQI